VRPRHRREADGRKHAAALTKGEKEGVVTPGNWKTMPEKRYVIGIGPFSNRWKKAETLENAGNFLS
jgi:hypothetical protein